MSLTVVVPQAEGGGNDGPVGQRGINVLTAVHQEKEEALTRVSHCQIMRARSRAEDMLGSYCGVIMLGPVQPHSRWIPGAVLKEDISVMWIGGGADPEEQFWTNWA